jgi:hypothetical protein
MNANFGSNGRKISNKLTNLVHESHYRKIIVLNEDGSPLLEFPLLLGVIVTLILPVLVGFLLLFFLMSGWHAMVERRSK